MANVKCKENAGLDLSAGRAQVSVSLSLAASLKAACQGEPNGGQQGVRPRPPITKKLVHVRGARPRNRGNLPEEPVLRWVLRVTN